MPLGRQQEVSWLEVPVDHGRLAAMEEAERHGQLEGPAVNDDDRGPPWRALLRPLLLVLVLQRPPVKVLAQNDLGLSFQAGTEEEHEVRVPELREDLNFVLEVKVICHRFPILQHFANDWHSSPVGSQHVALLPLSQQLPHLHLLPIHIPLLSSCSDAQRLRAVALSLHLSLHSFDLVLHARPGIKQELLYPGVPSPHSVLERTRSPPVHTHHVGSALDQELDDLVVPLSSCQMQRRATVVVARVHTRSLRHEILDLCQVALGGSVAHPVTMVLVVRMIVLLSSSSGVPQDRLNLRVTSSDSVFQRVASPSICTIYIRPIDYKEGNNFMMPLSGCQMQRRATVVVARVHTRVLGHQALDLLQIASARCLAHPLPHCHPMVRVLVAQAQGSCFLEQIRHFLVVPAHSVL
mmetsp:Transcript_17414/g.57642  ORF Transcript_17414/g.57642 Transcript_17414/m.57642 type:complete len:408 (+) Transcript_17414:537-1760(+)